MNILGTKKQQTKDGLIILNLVQLKELDYGEEFYSQYGYDLSKPKYFLGLCSVSYGRNKRSEVAIHKDHIKSCAKIILWSNDKVYIKAK
jgi:hypothetical protein